MKKIGIIGLGTITKHYLKGLEKSEYFTLAAVCDLSENAPQRKTYQAYPFYSDYIEMIRRENLDYVVVATPPSTHYEISLNALKNGANVIVEKPATTDMERYKTLIKTAKENGVTFEVMFHWQTGEEVVQFNRLYDKKNIEKIFVEVLDPYVEKGSIKSEKVLLSGVWMDSGVNVLSMIKTWLNFDEIAIKNIQTKQCETTALPTYIQLIGTVDGVEIEIVIDWTKGIDRKTTRLQYSGREIVIDNSRQTIIDGDKQMRFDEMERLTRHYYNYFTGYKKAISAEQGLKIHEFLFKVNERL